MRNLHYIIFLISVLLLVSCEDVIELDLPETEKRVVVDAWLTNTSEVQTVKLSYTGSYFDNSPTPMLTGATVTVSDNYGNIYELIEEEPGVYRQNFMPQVKYIYTLEITTEEGVNYISDPEVMEPVPDLEELYFEYKTKSIFEEEGYYVFIGLKDPAGEKNFYRWKYYINDVLQNTPDYFVFQNDDLVDGAELYDIQYNFEPLNVGDKVRIEQYAISEGAYNFLYIVREQITSGRGTFDAPPAPVKGNIYNLNNRQETVLGYFGVSAVDAKEIIIEEIE